MERLEDTVHPKEKIYFTLKLIFGIIGYAVLFLLLMALLKNGDFALILPFLYALPLVILMFVFRMGILVGYLRGNSVKVTPLQFPDIYEIVVKQCDRLEINTLPDIYILQTGGLLNAFATRFVGNNYIVLYSDVLEEAYETGMDSVEFIMGHELGHIKRKHMFKSIILFPSRIIPMLHWAYLRACEYTCDHIGAALNPDGAQNGLLILAAGKKIWQRMDSEQFMEQERTENGFWSWLTEKLSTHPKLTRRLIHLNKMNLFEAKQVKPEPVKVEVKRNESDHSAFMPRM